MTIETAIHVTINCQHWKLTYSMLQTQKLRVNRPAVWG